MKHTLLTALLAVGAVVANAATLTPEAALARASELMPRSTRPAAPSTIRPDLKLTLAADGQPTVYVFANGTRGYLVAAADDACPALLGYSDKDKFSGEAMAPALQYWLQEYSRQVAYARTQSNTVKVPAKARPVRAAIAPMVATRWNQDAPFNNDCPVINGERSVTGCVATALAQVMKYHNWPEHGTSSHSYTYNGQTISADFAKTTYDWANMRDVYTSSATAAQNAAVATLMFNCGVAVDMQYTAQESSSASFSVPAALINYFNYDKGVRYIPRDLYGLYDWEDLVYENLVTYGPVQYSGQSESGGHSFVCDGYSSDGYFHINWGWGGMSDGYFLLTALDPETQGIGGSTSSLLSYSAAKSSSKYPEKFGTGIIDGVIASETSNNAVIGGSLIPLITMGIPGNVATAIFLGGLTIHVLHTPGHSKGSVTLLVGDVLFTGDTLFAGSCGRTDLAGGSYEEIMSSLARLGRLEGDFRVLPGHEGESTLAWEREHNYYLKQAMAE